MTLDTVITVCISEARGIACDVGLSEIVKLDVETLRVRVIEWLRLPPVPVTVMV